MRSVIRTALLAWLVAGCAAPVAHVSVSPEWPVLATDPQMHGRCVVGGVVINGQAEVRDALCLRLLGDAGAP